MPLMDMPIMLVSKVCQNMNVADFSVLGKCFIDYAFFGDLGLTGIMIMSIFVGFVVRYNMPGGIILPIGTALSYLLYIMSGGSSIFLFLLIMTLIANGVLIVIGVMNYINR
jgi:ABC-type uncharacterized transport system permease subunit